MTDSRTYLEAAAAPPDRRTLSGLCHPRMSAQAGAVRPDELRCQWIAGRWAGVSAAGWSRGVVSTRARGYAGSSPNAGEVGRLDSVDDRHTVCGAGG